MAAVSVREMSVRVRGMSACAEGRSKGRDHGGQHGPGPWRDRHAYRLNWGIACLLPLVSLVLVGTEPRLRHWLMIPVTVCGVLIAVDAVEWFRRRTDVFDPRALIGLFGLHFFYLAPVLHVLLDYWAPEGIAPADWRDALGSLAVVNAIGLLIYRGVLAVRVPGDRVTRPARALDEPVLRGVGWLAVAVGVCAFVGELVLFGGVEGYLRTASTNREAFTGLGWLLIIGDSFPLIAFVSIVIRWRAALARQRWLLGLLLAGMVVTQFVVAGLRGSRTNFIWPVLVAVILIHLLVVPVSRRALGVAALALGVFLYGYGLYKGSGPRVLDIVRGERSIAQVSSDSNRDLPLVLLGDLGRADINARMLDRLRTGGASPAYGQTYLAGPALLVPQFILPERPRDKVAIGTDIIYGPGSYAAGVRSSRAYGITGEAIMNFGIPGGLLSFAALALAVRGVRRYYLRAQRGSGLVTALLAPSLCLLALNLLLWDFANIVWFVVKHLGPLAVVIALAIVGDRKIAGDRKRAVRRLRHDGEGSPSWGRPACAGREDSSRQRAQDDVLAQRPPASVLADRDRGAQSAGVDADL